jgi:hypothetical protein
LTERLDFGRQETLYEIREIDTDVDQASKGIQSLSNEVLKSRVEESKANKQFDIGLKETQKLIAESLTSFLIALKQRVTDTTDSQTAQLAIKLEKIALYLEKRVVRGLKSAQNKTNCPSN